MTGKNPHALPASLTGRIWFFYSEQLVSRDNRCCGATGTAYGLRVESISPLSRFEPRGLSASAGYEPLDDFSSSLAGTLVGVRARANPATMEVPSLTDPPEFRSLSPWRPPPESVEQESIPVRPRIRTLPFALRVPDVRRSSSIYVRHCSGTCCIAGSEDARRDRVWTALFPVTRRERLTGPVRSSMGLCAKGLRGCYREGDSGGNTVRAASRCSELRRAARRA